MTTTRRRLLAVPLAALTAAAAGLAPALAAGADPPRYRTYYSLFDRGPKLIPYHDSRYVPQGLGYWAARDDLVISYYDARGGRSRIAIVDRSTGTRVKTLILNTTGHVGGLGLTPGYLWIANDLELVRYSTAKLERAADSSRITADKTYSVPASSFVGVRGNTVWVGKFATSGSPRAYRYTVTAGGGLRDDHVSFRIPTRVQGMAATAAHLIWSRSFGRDNDSAIEVHPVGDPTGSARRITAPNMSEGLAIGRGELHVLYESGADEYHDADYRVRTVHHGPVAGLGG